MTLEEGNCHSENWVSNGSWNLGKQSMHLMCMANSEVVSTGVFL